MAKSAKPLGYGDLLGVFDKFWIIFLKVTDNAGLAVSPRSLPFNILFSEYGKFADVTLNTPLHLKNWPYRAASGSMTLHIILNATEKVDLVERKIINSWVRVVYYREKPTGGFSLLPIESIHYDYKASPDPAHPVFHAQFCRDEIDGIQKEKVETLRRFSFEIDRMGDRYGNLKIPTAHMDIISVLICLCADHISSNESSRSLKTLFDTVRDLKNMPTAEATVLTNGIIKAKSYCSVHWYVT